MLGAVMPAKKSRQVRNEFGSARDLRSLVFAQRIKSIVFFEENSIIRPKKATKLRRNVNWALG